jgi:hypothetical protein
MSRRPHSFLASARRLASLCAVLLMIGSAGTTARAASGSTGWPTFGYDVERSGFKPTTWLKPSNVPKLQPAWTVDLPAVTITTPIVVRRLLVQGTPRTMIFVGTEGGDVVAVNGSGTVVWQRHLGSVVTTCRAFPGGMFGISGTPVFDAASGRLYVASSDAGSGHVQVYALDAATGDVIPGWPVSISDDPGHEHVWSALTLFDGSLYAVTAGMCDKPPYFGRVFAIDTSTAMLRSYWSVVHDGDDVTMGGGIWGYGGASVDPRTGDVFVATGNALDPEPEDQPYAESVVRLDGEHLSVVAANTPSQLDGTDIDFGATPLLFQPPGCPMELAAMNKTGTLLLYLANSIETGPVQRIVMAGNLGQVGKFIGVPSYSPLANLVFVADPGPDLDPFVHGMVALRPTARCKLRMAWQRRAGKNGTSTVSTPSVAGGVVYYGTGGGAKVVAFEATTGRRLWDSGSTLGERVFAAPSVAGGSLYVASWDDAGGGVLTAFRTG